MPQGIDWEEIVIAKLRQWNRVLAKLENMGKIKKVNKIKVQVKVINAT